MQQASTGLSRILKRFSDKEKLAEIGRKMGRNSKPPLLNPTTLIPPRQWNGRDWLHWKRPGAFASTPRARAQASGDGGDVVGCNPKPSGDPPEACEDKTPPVWVDPTLTDPKTNAPFKAPSPKAKHDPDVGEVVSGIVLGLAGIVSCFLGGAAIGIPALAGGIGMIIDGEKNLNWDELECHLYWTSVYLFKGLDALHKLTVFAGLQHPFPAEFTKAQQEVQFNDSLPLSYLSAANVCKSRGMEGLHVPWTGALSTWNTYPDGTALEMPLTNVWPFAGLWPSAIVEDALANGATQVISGPPPAWPGGIQG